jgi:hypothetical protein
MQTIWSSFHSGSTCCEIPARFSNIHMPGSLARDTAHRSRPQTSTRWGWTQKSVCTTNTSVDANTSKHIILMSTPKPLWVRTRGYGNASRGTSWITKPLAHSGFVIAAYARSLLLQLLTMVAFRSSLEYLLSLIQCKRFVTSYST